MAQFHEDARNLRSNITLVLQNSTIIPFRFINTGKYICLYCDKSYLFFKELKKHIIETHTDMKAKDIARFIKIPKDLVKGDISDIKCKLCETNFKSVEKLVDHLIIVHNKSFNQSPQLKPWHGILGFDLSTEDFKCHICNKEFNFFKNLSVHMNDHSDNFMCHVCGKKFVTDHRLQAHEKLHLKRDIKCKHCDKVFKSIPAKTHHVRKVHTGSKFKCFQCSEVFPQDQHRLQHMVEVHKLKKPEFRCDICVKTFANCGSLRAHMRHIHIRSKEYVCEVCGQKFYVKRTWEEHLVLHTGEKRFECKFCDKKFAKLNTLRVHTRIHLNDRRFVCGLCKAAFIQKNSLKNHVRVHHSDAGIDIKKV